ncbi:MAG: glycosyltransferase family 4 protein [Chloroflexi bacterium]|nr:MAG: glycosyltransferase family 4 protein [Chloroflexota bacterium]
MARIALIHDIAGVAQIQAKILRSAGHEVDQISLSQIGATWEYPAKAVTIPLRLLAYLPTIWRLRRGPYDVIHIHWLTPGIVGLGAGKPFFVQAHGSDLHLNLRNGVLRWLTRWILNQAKVAFYVTPNLLSYLAGFEKKSRYLPNPVDVSEMAPKSTPPTTVSRVLVFTRIDPVKGVDVIFPAAATLSRAFEVTALDWGPLAREYVRLYGSSVKFVPRVPHDVIGSFLQQFDVVIGQMRQGILSLMEIEAMAAGRPLITGIDAGLYPDDPPPVVAAHDSDAIVAAVEKLRNDSAEMARLSNEGRQWVCRNHGYAHHLEILEKAYFG